MYWNDVLKRMGIFAQGSWFIYLIGSILLFLSLTITKNITRKEWVLLFGMVGFYGWMLDIILFYLLDLMDSGKPAIGEIPDIFMFVIGPAATAILFLNRYNTPTKLIRVLIFSLFSFLFEYMLGKLGFLKLNGWKPVYSIPFYLLLFGIVLPWTLKLIRK